MDDTPAQSPVDYRLGTGGIMLREAWYYALPSTALARNAVTHRTLLGEPVLIGRDAGGRVVRAMRDHLLGRTDGASLLTGGTHRVVASAGHMARTGAASQKAGGENARDRVSDAHGSRSHVRLGHARHGGLPFSHFDGPCGP